MASVAENRRFGLRKPLIAAAVALLVSLLITIYGTEIDWFVYAVAVAVVASTALLGSIALRAVFRKRQHVLMALAIFGAYVVVTGQRTTSTDAAVDSLVAPVQERSSSNCCWQR